MRAMPYPCRCLWRGLEQMTMVRPCRLITRQRSHMGFTDGRTFKLLLAVAEGDPAAGEVIGRELDLDAVAGGDADVVLAHLPRDRGEDGMTAVELHPEHRAGERLDDLAFDLDLLFLDWHRPLWVCDSRTRGKARRYAARVPILAERSRAAPPSERPYFRVSREEERFRRLPLPRSQSASVT